MNKRNENKEKIPNIIKEKREYKKLAKEIAPFIKKRPILKQKTADKWFQTSNTFKFGN